MRMGYTMLTAVSLLTVHPGVNAPPVLHPAGRDPNCGSRAEHAAVLNATGICAKRGLTLVRAFLD